jgi:hypothetical protein
MIGMGILIGGSLPPAEAEEKEVEPQPVTINKTRDMRYGEILVVTEKGVLVYNTTGLNDCPAKLWDAMDVEKIKQQFGAKAV